MKDLNTRDLMIQIAQILYDKKAKDVIALNVTDMTVITDGMVIATGRSTLQVRTLTQEVEEKLEEMGLTPIRREGFQDGLWSVLDYGTVLVHIFHEDEREFYRLEKLWESGENRVPLPFEKDAVDENAPKN